MPGEHFNPMSWGVIRNQRPKIHRLGLVSTVGAPLRKISNIDCRVIEHARSQKAGLPFATRARKWELSIQEVRIENDLDRKFSKSKFFKVFLKTTSPRFIVPCSLLLLAEIFFSKLVKMKILITKSTKIVQLVLRKLVKNQNFDYVINDRTPPPP